MEERKLRVYNKLRSEARARGKKIEFVSITKLNLFLDCKRSFKYKYVDKIKTEFKDSIYSEVGTMAHDMIEKYCTEDICKTELLTEIVSKSRGITAKYNLDENIDLIEDVKHFFKESTLLEKIRKSNKVSFEVPVQLQIKYNPLGDTEYWFVGFIDMLVENSDGTVSIYDFKTSNISGYSGKKLDHALIQLYSYAYIYEAMERVKVKDVAYLFIKYVDMTCVDSKGKIRKAGKTQRTKIMDTYFQKQGESDLEYKDCVVGFDFTKEVRLTYIKRLIDNFMNTKTELKFEADKRNQSYCDRFCEYKNGVCDWKDTEVKTDILMDMLNIMKVRNNG